MGGRALILAALAVLLVGVNKNQSPILVLDEAAEGAPGVEFVTQFSEAATAIDPGIGAFVLVKLQDLTPVT